MFPVKAKDMFKHIIYVLGKRNKIFIFLHRASKEWLLKKDLKSYFLNQLFENISN